jgi:3'(2'), 5'-bisphosphate nucleotidase
MADFTMSLLAKVSAIARQAGEAIRQYYRRDDVHSSLKEDQSPVGPADLAACQLIRRELSKISDLPVITEEQPVDYQIRKNWKQFWLVDPLDGTREFSAGIDEFTVNIALIEDGAPKLGVIYAPALDELFFAELGAGAYVERNNARHRLPLHSDTRLIAGRGRFQNAASIDQFLEANQIKDVVVLGASLKFCRLAEGVINIYPRYFVSKEWDIAAGHIIINEAGCYMFDTNTMMEPVYNKRSFENAPFIACSGSVERSMLKMLPVKQ